MIGLSTDEWTDVDLGLTFIVAIKEGELYGAGSNTFPAVASIGPRLALVVPKASESGAPAAVQVWRA